MKKVKIVKIRRALVVALTMRGIPREEAKVIANEYLDGEIQGRYSHGLFAFPSLIKKLTREKTKIKIIKKTNSLVYIDANKNVGAWVGSQAADLAMTMAEKEGVAIVLIKNMITWLRPGTIAKKVAKKGYIGLVLNNGGTPMVAPPGGYDPVIGTNPIGIGIPTSKDPIVVDMATSKNAWGEVGKAERTGNDLPKNSFYDKKGGIAVKAKDAYSALPAGDYKGFSIGLLIEILTGSYLDNPMGQLQLKASSNSSKMGGVVLVINPAITTELTQFRKANTRLIQDVKKSRKLKKTIEILIPGERAAKTRKNNIANGYLEIDINLWKTLEDLLIERERK